MGRARPEELYDLFADLKGLDGVGPKSAKSFAALGVRVPKDLLFTLPASGIDRRRIETVLGVVPPAVVTVEVAVGRHRPGAGRGPNVGRGPGAGRGPYRIEVTDAATTFLLVFFHARPAYLQEVLPPGERRLISGKLEHFDGVAQIVHPDHILEPGAQIPPFEPVYPLATGLTQRTVARAVAGALARAPHLGEWIDLPHLKAQAWPAWHAAVHAAHTPQTATDVSLDAPARARLAYDEVFAHQLTLALARGRRRRSAGIATAGDGRLRRAVLDALPYRPTGAQRRAAEEIAADMAAPHRMRRLLQGDVGAGKTLVALLALLAAVEAGGQGVLMAPTGILARQHLAGLATMVAPAGVRIELLTGADKTAARARKLADLAAGRIDVLVGTHAVFQPDVVFADLRLAVVDEQHRFGVRERIELSAKGRAADLLVMTATPIPRTLSLTQYGDMDVSVLDEKPPGRTPVTTALVSMERMDEVTAHLRRAIASGRQAYWVCPLVEESEVSEKTAAEERAKRLMGLLGPDAVGLVHGQMPDAARDGAMADFKAGRTSVLVATTVIEVGVDVPNASIMVIEQAEGFGLAQLHQLRGRVGRGSAASTCLLLYRPPLGETARRRLQILRETEDGFRIAEEDLAIRGAGDVIGTAQSGLPRFRVACAERQAGLIETARRDAQALIAADPDLVSPRGQSARTLLYLMERDEAIRLIGAG